MLNESLKECHTKFCQIRLRHDGSKEWLLTRYSFLYPTTLMPLLEYITDNNLDVKFHPDVEGYLNTIMDKNIIDKSPLERTYIKVAMLNPKHVKGIDVLNEVINLLSKYYGGLDALYYLLYELTSNIYDHSRFSRAFVMAQEFPQKEFIEICIYDNGISIPQCFKNHGYDFGSDANSIYNAINGKSTKSKEAGRGYGINTSARMVLDGFNGEIFIASRNGAIHLDNKGTTAYKCENAYELEGTLVSMRLPKVLINYAEHINSIKTFSKFKEEKRCR